MIKDTVSMYVEKEWENCKRIYTWSDLKKWEYYNNYELICLDWEDKMLVNLNVTIGTKQSLPIKTYILENQVYLAIQGLRTHVAAWKINKMNDKLDLNTTNCIWAW